MRSVLMRSITGILSCNFTALRREIFIHRFISHLGWNRALCLSLSTFRDCMKMQMNFTHCLAPLISKCRKSTVVAVKVIRLNMQLVEELLNEDLDLRVIHLVRDPRGMLQSWRKMASVRQRSNEAMQTNANIACNRILDDCHIRHRLEKTFPGRITLLRYEDLVTDTNRILSSVYICWNFRYHSLLESKWRNNLMRILLTILWVQKGQMGLIWHTVGSEKSTKVISHTSTWRVVMFWHYWIIGKILVKYEFVKLTCNVNYLLNQTCSGRN